MSAAKAFAERLEGPWLPAAITFLAFSFRLLNLGGQSLWYDEAYTLLLVSYGPVEIAERAAQDTQQPLYFWLLSLWGMGPPVDFYPRFLSVLAGTLAIPLVYAVARRLLGTPAALAASLLAAVSPFHVFYSQEVRMYALLGVWNLLAAWGFIEGVWRNRHRGWVLYGAGTLLALYTHALGWFPSLALFLWAVASRLTRERGLPGSAGLQTGPAPRANPTPILPPALAMALAFLLYLPWAAALAQQVPRVFTSFWAAPPGVLSPIASLHVLFFGPFTGAVFPLALTALLLALGLTVPVILRPGPARAPLTLLWAWVLAPLLLLFGLSLVRSVYLERIVVGAAFPVYILMGWVAVCGREVRSRRFSARWVAVTLLALVLLSALWGLKNWYTEPSFGKPPLHEAAALVAGTAAPGEPVLHTSDGSYLPFLLYAPELPNVLLAGDPEAAAGTPRARSTYLTLGVTPVDPAQAVGAARRFHLVVALDHSLEFQRTLAEDMDRRYRRVTEQQVGGIVLRTYQNP